MAFNKDRLSGCKKNLGFIMAVSLILLGMTACARPPDQPGVVTATPAVEKKAERTVVIGFTVSQTGKLSVESMRQANGFHLWVEEINARGGMELEDGSIAKIAAKVYDDESSKDRVRELYTKLVTQDGAELLISPYSSNLTDAAAEIAQQHGKIMITAGAASDSTHTRGYSLIYQSYTPASRYLTGALQLLGKVDPQARQAALICEQDEFAAEACAAASAEAARLGVSIKLHEEYEAGEEDFGPVIGKIPSGATAVMGGGHFADTSALAGQLYEKRFPAKFIVLLVAPPEPKFGELGEAALGVIGPSQWETGANYNINMAMGADVEWFGPSGTDFIASYRKKYEEEPSYHAAGGYVAGLILQKAIVKAGVLDNSHLLETLDGLDMMTFFGQIRFETEPDKHGLQIGHEMVYIQWQKDAQNQLHKQIIWPAQIGSAPVVYPAR